MGGAISYMGYSLLAFLLAIWMAAIIARSSGFLWALVCFIFWPAATPHFFRHWGDEGNDIRIPFLFIIVATVMSFWAMNKTMQQLTNLPPGRYVIDEEKDLSTLRIYDARVAGIAEELWDEVDRARPVELLIDPAGMIVTRIPEADDQESNVSSPRVASSGSERARPAEAETTASAPGTQVSVRTKAIRLAERGLQAQRGRIELGEAGALDLPPDYIYVEARHLALLANIGAGRVDRHTLGWIIHRERRFSDEDGWHVELRWIPGEHAAPGDGEAWRSGLAGIEGVEASEPALMPGWNAETGIATFFDRDPRVGVEWQRAHALKAVAGGVIQATVESLEPGERELGLRAARFLASRVTAPAAASPGGKPLLELARREAGAEPLPASG
jgi:hypothetical protein